MDENPSDRGRPLPTSLATPTYQHLYAKGCESLKAVARAKLLLSSAVATKSPIDWKATIFDAFEPFTIDRKGRATFAGGLIVELHDALRPVEAALLETRPTGANEFCGSSGETPYHSLLNHMRLLVEAAYQLRFTAKGSGSRAKRLDEQWTFPLKYPAAWKPALFSSYGENLCRITKAVDRSEVERVRVLLWESAWNAEVRHRTTQVGGNAVEQEKRAADATKGKVGRQPTIERDLGWLEKFTSQGYLPGKRGHVKAFTDELNMSENRNGQFEPKAVGAALRRAAKHRANGKRI